MESLAKLGIDGWGLLVYIVNFGLLWAALAYLVFPKLIHSIDARRKQIEDNLTTAERLQVELEKTVEKSQQEKINLEKSLATERETFDKEMNVKRIALNTDAEARRTALIEEARKLIQEEKKALIADTEGEMITLMQRVLIKVLGEKVDPADVSASVEQVWKEVKEEVRS